VQRAQHRTITNIAQVDLVMALLARGVWGAVDGI
jgi:hypothetical protein